MVRAITFKTSILFQSKLSTKVNNNSFRASSSKNQLVLMFQILRMCHVICLIELNKFTFARDLEIEIYEYSLQKKACILFVLALQKS